MLPFMAPMALTATVYNLDTELADIDRGVYETLAIRMARQPSETAEYMLARYLAYCLEYAEGITFTEGVAAGGEEPAVMVRDLTGQVTAWIEVGMPSAERLHRGSKLAGRAAVYTHRDARKLVAELSSAKIHRAEDIPIFAFDRNFIETLAALLERRTELSLSVTEGELFVEIGAQNLHSSITRLRLER